MSTTTIHTTKNYSLFTLSKDNRKIEISRRGKLVKSMKAYCFLQGFPVMCKRDGEKLVIIDGQHRFMIAQELGLPIYYTVEKCSVDVAVINAAQQAWNLTAYVNRYIAQGNNEYEKLREFAELHKLPLHAASAILIGHNTGTNASVSIKNGTFRITDWVFATHVARVFSAVREAAKECATAQSLRAVAAICTIHDIDHDRLIKNIMRRADMLRRYNNRDACLDMFEAIYNDASHSKNKRPIAFEANKILSERRYFGKNGPKK
jgi:hypothetical protein